MAHPTWGIILFILAASAIAGGRYLARRRGAPQTLEDYLRAGDRAASHGRIDEAASLYREAIRLDHTNPAAHYKLGAVLFDQGDHEGAVIELQSCLRWGPEHPQIHANLGAAYYRRGDREEALVHWRRALDLAPDANEFKAPLAQLYWELGREDEARAVLPEFQPLSPQEKAREEQRESAWARLGPSSRARLRGWELVSHGLMGLVALCAIGVAVCVLLLGLGIAYRLLFHPAGFALSDFVGTLLFAIKRLLVGACCSYAALNVLTRMGDTIIRREMIASTIPVDDVDAVAPRGSGPPFWRVELSGAHVILWAAFPFLVFAFRRAHELPDWVVVPAIYFLVLWVVKGGILVSLMLGDWGENDKWLRQYQWFGTLRGSVVALVGFPACVGLIMLLLWWLFGLIWG